MTSVKGHFHFIYDKVVKSATGALYVLVWCILYAAATIFQGTTVYHTNYTFHNSLQIFKYLHEMPCFLIAYRRCANFGEL
jgi:hypothetical protein